jgi:dimethylargininase
VIRDRGATWGWVSSGDVATALLPDDRRGTALVRRPGAALGDGLTTHIDRLPVDADLAARQWEDYVAAFHAHGWPTIEVEPADDLPDAPFVEDTAVVVGDLAVIARPGAGERRAETAATETVLAGLGYRTEPITGPGTLDGGDVLKLQSTFFVGLGGRTNAEGVRQLAALVAPLGIKVVPVRVSRALHLKSSLTALPDGTVLGHLPVLDQPELIPNLEPVAERNGWRVVLLGDDRLLISTSAPRTSELLERKGYRLVTVDISEFEKREASVTCLSVRLRGHGAETVR